MVIGIINYGVGNIGSVIGSINNLGFKYKVIENAEEFDRVDEKNFSQRIKEKVLVEEVPILGICLGMQLLASFGAEGNDDNSFSEGLDLISGNIINLKQLGSNLVLPHVGWNNISINKQTNLIKNIPDNTDFYFVHSYAFSNINQEYIVAEACYGVSFPVVVNYKNVWGTQFHPEKSSVAGLEIIKNFINL